MGDAAGSQYDDGNRAFLQSLMARGTMTYLEAQKVLAEIFTVQQGTLITPEEISQDEFEEYVDAARQAVSDFDYDIKSVQHQITKTRYYALINTTSDPLTQIATIHTPEEVGFIKRMIEAMFETYNTKRREIMAVTGMQAVEKKIIKGTSERRESGPQIDKGLSVGEAEQCLQALVNEGWFEYSAQGFYTLSPRALMELRSWLVESYNDPNEPEEWQPVKLCAACKEIVTIGQRCADLECNCRLHDICLTFAGRGAEKKCPNCETPWDGRHFVGQRAASKADEILREKRRSGGRRRHQEEEVEEDEPLEDEENGEDDGEDE